MCRFCAPWPQPAGRISQVNNVIGFWIDVHLPRLMLATISICSVAYGENSNQKVH
jgi:hypothetical protein